MNQPKTLRVICTGSKDGRPCGAVTYFYESNADTMMKSEVCRGCGWAGMWKRGEQPTACAQCARLTPVADPTMLWICPYCKYGNNRTYPVEAPPRTLQREDDAVHHPKHYTSDPSGVECITITRHRNFNIGNAIKYLWRCGLKEVPGKDADPTTQDMNKAIWYILDEIKRLGGTTKFREDP